MFARTSIKRIAVVVASFGALALPAVAQAWTSNNFRSPSGNIICHYAPSGAWIACATLNNTNVVVVDTTHAYHSTQRTFSGGGPVLQYGQKYTTNNGRFVCLSRSYGMGCVNHNNGHGFALNRSGYRLF